MAENKFIYYYADKLPKEEFSKWLAHSETICRNINGKVEWENIGATYLKNQNYIAVVKLLINPDQNFYNVLKFCDTNSNCVEIEILRRKKVEPSLLAKFDNFSGHHIFASCLVDLSKLISGDTIPLFGKCLQVKWIHNYGSVQQDTLEKFLELVKGLQANPLQPGIVFKLHSLPSPDNFEAHKHLSFVFDLRKYCGDITGLQTPATIFKFGEDSLCRCVKEFHEHYVASNKLPSPQVTWKFLHTLKEHFDFSSAGKSLDWSNVKRWTEPFPRSVDKNKFPVDTKQVAAPFKPLNESLQQSVDKTKSPLDTKEVEATIKLFKEAFPEFESPSIGSGGTLFGMSLVMDLKEFAFKKLMKEVLSINPSAYQHIPDGHESGFNDFMQESFKFLEVDSHLKMEGELLQEIETKNLQEQAIVFEIYEQLFKTKIINDMKDSHLRVTHMLPLLIKTVKQNALIASFSVPESNQDNNTKTLTIIVNNDQEFDRTEAKTELLAFVRGKTLPKIFSKSRFDIACDAQKVDLNVDLLAADHILQTIVKDVEVDRIDGQVVIESQVRATALEKWTNGAVAATKFVMVSHMFLKQYYKKENLDECLKGDSEKTVQELINEAAGLVENLNKDMTQLLVVSLQQKLAQITLLLFQLSAKFRQTLADEPSEPLADEVTAKIIELNKNLMALMKSKSIPIKST